MRRILLLMVAVLCITVASAQEKGETAVGAQVVYGSGDGIVQHRYRGEIPVERD